MTDGRVVTVNGNWPLWLPTHRADRAEWTSTEGWEREALDSICANVSHGDLMIDVGAEEGDMSALWAMWGCDVALIEPNPKVWPNIAAIFEGNGLPAPLYTHVGFAGDTLTQWNDGWYDEFCGEAWKADPGSWPSCAYGEVIGDHGFLNLSERPEVPVITIDWLANALGRCDAITVDVEGAELAVMRGAEQTLREHRPFVWISVHPEFGFDMYGTYANDLHSFMHSCGYIKRWLAFDHEEHWCYCPDERRDEFVLQERVDWT